MIFKLQLLVDSAAFASVDSVVKAEAVVAVDDVKPELCASKLSEALKDRLAPFATKTASASDQAHCAVMEKRSAVKAELLETDSFKSVSERIPQAAPVFAAA